MKKCIEYHQTLPLCKGTATPDYNNARAVMLKHLCNMIEYLHVILYLNTLILKLEHFYVKTLILCENAYFYAETFKKCFMLELAL